MTKTPSETLDYIVNVSIIKSKKPFDQILVSSMLAGIYLSIAGTTYF
jgi:formate/nitrite transporter FocA (FNT family)